MSKCYKCEIKVIPSNSCGEHYPSWIVRRAMKIDSLFVRLRFFVKGGQKFSTDNVDDMIALDDLEKSVSGDK